eukprot:UN05018
MNGTVLRKKNLGGGCAKRVAFTSMNLNMFDSDRFEKIPVREEKRSPILSRAVMRIQLGSQNECGFCCASPQPQLSKKKHLIGKGRKYRR